MKTSINFLQGILIIPGFYGNYKDIDNLYGSDINPASWTPVIKYISK